MLPLKYLYKYSPIVIYRFSSFRYISCLSQ